MTGQKRAIVTGPTGAVGTALCSVLLEGGWDVTAVIHAASRRIGSIPDGVRVILLSLDEIGKLPQVLSSNADVFFHLGWRGTIGPERNDMDMQAANIRSALDAVETASRLGCGVFVGAGSQAEYGRIEGMVRADSPCSPGNGYGMAKLAAGFMTREKCHVLGIRHVWPRLLSVYGPHDNPRSVLPMLLEALIRKEPFPLTAGEQMWDYLYAEDAGRALLHLALEGKDGSIYPVGSGEVRTLRSCFEALRDAVCPGMELEIGRIPYPPGQVMYLQADTEPLFRDTTWRPQVSFAEGIRRTVKARLAEGGKGTDHV